MLLKALVVRTFVKFQTGALYDLKYAYKSLILLWVKSLVVKMVNALLLIGTNL